MSSCVSIVTFVKTGEEREDVTDFISWSPRTGVLEASDTVPFVYFLLSWYHPELH